MKAVCRGAAAATVLLITNLTAQGPPGSLRGIVFDSLVAGGPLVGAQIELLELGRRTTTDSRGVFRLDSIPVGRYTLSYTHPTLTAIGFLPPERPVEVGAGVDKSVVLATPAPGSIFRRLCPASVELKTGVVLGKVSEAATDSGLGGADVRAEWTETTLSRTVALNTRPRVARATTEPSGRYQLCGVPTDVPLLLRVAARGVEGAPIELSMADRMIAVRQLLIDLSPPTETGRARVVGRVTSSGAPVANAQIVVLGETQAIRTDADGSFMLDHLNAGTHTLEARAIGYLRQRQQVDLKPNQPLTLALNLNRAAVQLPEITVSARRVSTAVAGFEQRRLTGNGRFMTREDIVRRGSIRVEDLFRGMAGVMVQRIGADDYQILSTRGGAGISAACPPTVYIDGIRIPADPENGNALPILPNEIHGIEVYLGLESAPIEYRPVGGCGVILIWTRRGGR